MTYEEVKELIRIFEDTDLNDMEITLDGASVRLNRSKINCFAVPGVPYQQNVPEVNPANSMQSPAEPAEPLKKSVSDEKEHLSSESKSLEKGSEEDSSRYITCPMVGTFYSSSSPEEKPYVNVGDTVKKGDTVCIIEAMKYMNEVQTGESGKIAEIYVQDGDLVEYGQKLFRIV